MTNPTLLPATPLPLVNSISRSLSQRRFLAAIASVVALIACFVFLSAARAEDGAVGDGTSTAEGIAALANLTTGIDNTAIGFTALEENQTASYNTAIGFNALTSNSSGAANTATGVQALQDNQTGNFNTATGAEALSSNNADNNTANGFEALFLNSSGNNNTANGYAALYNNTTGGDNTGTGFEALVDNTTGVFNTADGDGALFHNTGGKDNTGSGAGALFENTTGGSNVGDGFQTLHNNTTGSSNIAVGFNSGYNLTTGSNNIDIGAPGTAGEANTIRIGKSGTQQKAFIAGISGKTVASGVGVIINANGQLGTIQSSARFKQDVQPMDKTSEAILKLKPVTFRYKEELDPDKIPQFGLVAEQVEKVNPDLVIRDEEGKVMSVRYEAVNAMLLNEFLKEHRTVQEQHAMIRELKSAVAKQEATSAQQTDQFRATIAQQQKQIEALTAGLQKVSTRLELNKPAPQLVTDDR